MMLALKMGEEATSQGMKKPLEGGKGKAMESPRVYKKECRPAQTWITAQGDPWDTLTYRTIRY